eukprot:TRINITY_DN12276_c0_g1_i6.p2 TRINITY_DN12276_c0_g1~~TRINITY_DN12276_c0_g1_i6.p2  ORF type:complete len:119 (+),score=17.16 TRINITY_DN12276_c0_g1_i6:112-468(+)
MHQNQGLLSEAAESSKLCSGYDDGVKVWVAVGIGAVLSLFSKRWTCSTVLSMICDYATCYDWLHAHKFRGLAQDHRTASGSRQLEQGQPARAVDIELVASGMERGASSQMRSEIFWSA